MTILTRAAEFRFTIDASASAPTYRQIYERIRAAILAGHLPPGARLPSWAGLAGELGVARGTIKAAYDWLAGEGYIISHGQAGTTVNLELARALGHEMRMNPSERPRQEAKRFMVAASEGKTVPQQSVSGEASPFLFGERPVPFQAGVPALDAFPRTLWSRLMAHAAREMKVHDMIYLNPVGHASLREMVAR